MVYFLEVAPEHSCFQKTSFVEFFGQASNDEQREQIRAVFNNLSAPIERTV